MPKINTKLFVGESMLFRIHPMFPEQRMASEMELNNIELSN